MLLWGHRQSLEMKRLVFERMQGVTIKGRKVTVAETPHNQQRKRAASPDGRPSRKVKEMPLNAADVVTPQWKYARLWSHVYCLDGGV